MNIVITCIIIFFLVFVGALGERCMHIEAMVTISDIFDQSSDNTASKSATSSILIFFIL